MTAVRDQKLEIFYDGACHLCSHEISYYRKKDTQSRINFVDISRPDFIAEEHHLEPAKVQTVMHARARSGEVITGVDAFFAIWDEIDGFKKFSKIGRLPPIKLVLKAAYHVFASYIRPILPKKKNCALPETKP